MSTLDELKAAETVECACSGCQRACSVKPGWFAPGEAEHAAAYLGVTLKELFDTKLMVDWLAGSSAADGDDVFVLSPATTSGRPGQEFPGNPRGTCVFLTEDKRCAIHEVKPMECRLYSCRGVGIKYHEPVGMTWDAPEHQQQIEGLLGRPPESEAYGGFFGGLSLFFEDGP
ncbi:hypothetical protein D3C87_848060 [compost metagenome]